MASPDIEPQVMDIGPLLGQRLDESAPRTLPLTAPEVQVRAGGPVMTGCGSRKHPA
jgi:hypothetical protein